MLVQFPKEKTFCCSDVERVLLYAAANECFLRVEARGDDRF
jgi:hypothetical protein